MKYFAVYQSATMNCPEMCANDRVLRGSAEALFSLKDRGADVSGNASSHVAPSISPFILLNGRVWNSHIILNTSLTYMRKPS